MKNIIVTNEQMDKILDRAATLYRVNQIVESDMTYCELRGMCEVLAIMLDVSMEYAMDIARDYANKRYEEIF